MKTLKQFKEEQMKDPEFVKEYEALRNEAILKGDYTKMLVEISMYESTHTELIAKGKEEFNPSYYEYFVFNVNGYSRLSFALYANNVISADFKENFDYLVHVNYGENVCVTVLDERDDDVKVEYTSERPTSKGSCTIARIYGSDHLICTVNDGYNPVRTYSATSVSIELGGAE